MKKIALVLAAVLIFSGCSLNIFDRYASIDVENSDYQLLLSPEVFAYGPVGAAGVTPGTVKAVGNLLKHDNALAYFVSLEKNANSAGKLYALCGIYRLDPDLFQSLLKDYKNNDDTVQMMGGCILTHEVVKDIIFDPKRETEEKSEGSYFDFLGGKIPAMLLSYS
ncbi:MAG: hypothetical protein ACK5LX_13390 [Oscillospiraceae bacterium]